VFEHHREHHEEVARATALRDWQTLHDARAALVDTARTFTGTTADGRSPARSRGRTGSCGSPRSCGRTGTPGGPGGRRLVPGPVDGGTPAVVGRCGLDMADRRPGPPTSPSD